jgi:hypothetical protein
MGLEAKRGVDGRKDSVLRIECNVLQLLRPSPANPVDHLCAVSDE